MVAKLKNQAHSPAILPPYPNGWYMILESDQLEESDFRQVRFLGMTILVWRFEIIYVLEPCCSQFVVAEGDDSISCELHGYILEGHQGKLVNLFRSSSEHCGDLKTFRIFEQNDLIYIWHHEDEIEPTWYPMEIPEIQDGSMCFRGRFECIAETHIRDVAENYADLYHFDMIHPDGFLLAIGGAYIRKLLAYLDPTNFKFSLGWRTSEDPKKRHISLSTTSSTICLFGKPMFETMSHQLTVEGPGVITVRNSIVASLAVVMLVTTTPIGGGKLRMVERFYFKKWTPSIFALMFMKFAENTLLADLRIWNKKIMLKSPCLTKKETRLKQFRVWFSQFFTNNTNY